MQLVDLLVRQIPVKLVVKPGGGRGNDGAQRVDLIARIDSAHPVVFGVGTPLDPALFLEPVEHLACRGTPHLHDFSQLALRGARVLAHMHDGGPLCARDPVFSHDMIEIGADQPGYFVDAIHRVGTNIHAVLRKGVEWWFGQASSSLFHAWPIQQFDRTGHA
jgi:hypothetical protein